MKIALAGAIGHWTHVFDEFAEMPDLEMVGVARLSAEDDIEKAQKHAFSRGKAQVYDSVGDMLRSANPDLVVVSSRLDLIGPAATEAARAGKHVISEKPLALDVDTLLKLHEAVSKSGVRLLGMLSMRALPVFQTMRRRYAEGAIGKIVLANARKSYQWGKRPEWFGDRAKYGGTIGWVGIHGLDMIQATTGEDFVGVAAMMGNYAHRDRPACEDNGALLLQLGSGAHATVSFDYFRPEAAKTHGDDWLRLVGTEGVMEGNNDGGWCRIIDAKGEREMNLDQAYPMYKRFVEALQSGKEIDSLLRTEDAFELTWVCLHAQESTAIEFHIPASPWHAKLRL